MKKYKVLLLVVIFVFSLLTACQPETIIKEVEVPGETIIEEVEVPGETIIEEVEVDHAYLVPLESKNSSSVKSSNHLRKSMASQ